MKYFLTLLLTILISCTNSAEKKEINTAITVDIESTNPYKLVSSNSTEIMYNIYEGLVMPGENGDLIPALAKSYSISEDGLVYEFIIRDNVYFHNGDKLTVEDVIFSLKKMKELKIQNAFLNIKEITKKDEKTVVVTLEQPDSSLMNYFRVAIVNKRTFDSIDEKANGTGPYAIKEHIREQKLVLERHEKYYGEKAHIKRINIAISPNPDTNFLRLLSGEYNFLSYINTKREAELKNFNFINQPQNMVFVFGLNNEKIDKNTRAAINAAVNKDDIIQKTTGSKSLKLSSNMSPIYEKYYNANVKEVLGDTNLLKGKTFILKIPTNSNIYIDVAQIIKEELLKYGANLKIVELEFATWLQEVYTNRDFEMTLIVFTGKLDPDAILKRYSSNYKRNFIGFKNEEYDNLIVEAKRSVDTNKRVELYKKAQQILADEIASVYIMDPTFIVAYSKDITGYTKYPISYINFSKLKFSE